MFAPHNPPKTGTPVLDAPRTGIAPKRGECLLPGDVVCKPSGERYRILAIEHDARTIYSRGEWEIVDGRADVLRTPELCRQQFTVLQPKWYTTLQENAS